jgi:hypothetical protein
LTTSCANQSQDAWHEPLDEGCEISILFPEDQAKAKKWKEFSAQITHLVLVRDRIRVAALHEQLLLNWAAKQTKKQARQNFSFKLKAYNG